MAFNNNTTADHAGVAHKPTIGEKLSGAVDSLVGKATNNPAKVAQGEAKKTGEPLHGAAAGASQAVHQNTGNHGSGLTGNNNHGTGLTGNNHGSGLTGDNHNHGLTGNNHGSGLTGNNHGSGFTGDNNNHGLTGNNNHNSSNTGVLGGLTGNHGSHSSSNTGVLGDNHNHNHGSSGLTGNNHGSSNAGVLGGLTGNHNNHNQGSGFTGNNHNQGGLTGQHDSTALGGIAGGNHSHSHTTGSGLTGNHGYDNNNSGLTGNHNSGLTGSNHGYDNNNTHGNKPSVGDKLSGGLESMVGKATSNPSKVAEGEAKKTGDIQHAQAAAANVGTDTYGNHQTGPNAGNFNNNTHNSATGGAFDNSNTGPGRY